MHRRTNKSESLASEPVSFKPETTRFSFFLFRFVTVFSTKAVRLICFAELDDSLRKASAYDLEDP